MKFEEKKIKIPGLPDVKVYFEKSRELSVLLSVEDGLLHLSISHRERYPTWDEIKEARYQLCPDNVVMGMFLPPKEYYVNLDPNCFHLYEVRKGETLWKDIL